MYVSACRGRLPIAFIKLSTMKKLLFAVVALLISYYGAHSQAQSQDQEFLDYIEKYKDIAIREMERAGIPASIKLAQGLLESNAGRSPLARQANNHFGIKCGPDWKGKTYMQEDDEFDAKGKLIESCFRSYKTDEASYVAHSEFLRDPQKTSRYGFLFVLDPTDYKRWAYGLKRAGYATSATYPEKLISLIERYELFKYDKISTIDFETPAEEVMVGILSVNDVKYVVADSSETLADIARRTDVSLRNLLHYNEHIIDDGKTVPSGTKVFLQPKRSSYRGKQNWHFVKEGETMQDISLRYALNLSKLYKRNRLVLGSEPAANERIKLRGSKVKQRPKLASEVPAITPATPANGNNGQLEMEEEQPRPQPPVKPSQSNTKDNKPATGNSGTTAPPKPATDNKQPNFEPVKVEPEPSLPVITPQNTNPPTTKPVETKLEEPAIPPVEEVKPANNEQIKEEEAPSAPQQPAYHTVVKGDTLWNISQRYGTSVDELKKLNNLPDNNIKLGQQLRVK